MVEIWSEILREVKNSVFWVSENNRLFRENLVKEFNHQGIDSNRVIFAKRVESISDHLARLKLADLFLDTSPYNAHSTAIDAIKACVPILTLIGNSFPSLVTKSILTNFNDNSDGFGLAAKNREEYIRRAILLSKDSAQLNKFRERILASNIFSRPKCEIYCKNIETIFRNLLVNQSK